VVSHISPRTSEMWGTRHLLVIREFFSFKFTRTTGSGPRRAKLEAARLKKATGENSPHRRNESEV
jgi:hypothetical protein